MSISLERYAERHPHIADSAAIVVLFGFALLGGSLSTPDAAQPRRLGVVALLAGISCLALLGHRRHPHLRRTAAPSLRWRRGGPCRSARVEGVCVPAQEQQRGRGEAGISIRELLHRLRAERGTALLVVSHELHLVRACTETVHLLDTGWLTRQGPTARLLPQGWAGVGLDRSAGLGRQPRGLDSTALRWLNVSIE